MTQRRPAAPARSARAALGRTTLGVAALLGLAVAGLPAQATPGRTGSTPVVPVIHVDPTKHHSPVHLALLGANYRWFRNGGGAWRPKQHRVVPAIQRRMSYAGIQSARYPGGTVATLFDWKGTIGKVKHRTCQYDGHYKRAGQFFPVPAPRSFGPDEYMAFTRQTHTTPLLMETVVDQTAKDAADWVEYMNHPLHHGNPNGGVNYARLRAANGHPKPYHVRRWEVGNEPYVAPTRYAESSDHAVAIRQYADGGTRTIVREFLGKGCYHPAVGARSNGRPHQTFRTLYRPVTRRDFRLFVDGRRWNAVRSFRRSGPKSRVFVLHPHAGTVRFGDGRHGAIPRRHERVRANYTNHFDGFFAFAHAMKKVDPAIRVCASWGTPQFARAAAGRHFDCLTAHSITNFRKIDNVWSDKLEGHDRLMLALADRKTELHAILRSLSHRYPRHTPPLALSEFSAIYGDRTGWPYWRATISNGIYMASMWSFALNDGLPWATGGDLIGVGEGSVIGAPSAYTLSAEALVRRTLLPMLRAGGSVVGANVQGNPVYDTGLGTRRAPLTYQALQVSATRDRRGGLWLLVVNRLPDQAVAARIDLGGFTPAGTATKFETHAPRFNYWNRDNEPPRVLESSSTVPAAPVQSVIVDPNSVTVYHFAPQK